MITKNVHILMASCHCGDATGNHAIDLARLLSRQGWTVQIHVNGLMGALPQDIQPLVKHTRPADYIPAADLIIVEYAVWFPLAEWLRDAHCLVIFWYHGVTPVGLSTTNREHDFLLRSKFGAELAWYAHLAVVDSPFGAQELYAHSAYPAERTRIVPLGIDVSSFNEKPQLADLERLRQQWQLHGKRVLLYTGRIAGNKRIDLLIEALARLVLTYPDLHLLIVGDNSGAVHYRELTAELLAKAETLNVSECVTFTGRVPLIEPYYHLADCYVTASQHECFGVPLLEAMAAGLPIVASASGAMPWVLNAESPEHVAAGLIFPAGQIDILVEQVSRVLDDVGLRQMMIDHGYQRVNQFSKEVFCRNAAAVVDEVQSLVGEGVLLRRDVSPLVRLADIALHNYRVRSKAPLVGRLIEIIRYNMTTHVKEAYVDRMVEQQVLYNRCIVEEMLNLRAEVESLRVQVHELQKRKVPPSS